MTAKKSAKKGAADSEFWVSHKNCSFFFYILVSILITSSIKRKKQFLICSNFNENKRWFDGKAGQKWRKLCIHVNFNIFLMLTVFFNWTWIPGCWVHVSSILKTMSSYRVPKQSEKTLVVLAPCCQVTWKPSLLMTDLADLRFLWLAFKLNSSLFFVLQMRTAPPLLRFGILELGYHEESSSL